VTTTSSRRVGLLFPGEMGAAVGAGVRGEVVWAGEGRSEATARRALEAGFRDVDTLTALAGESDVVLSVCPPAAAEDVATAVAAGGFRGLFVDCNAVAPARAERIAALVGHAGARAVDGAIISRKILNLYLSGDPDDVGEAASLFAGSNVRAIVLAGPVGTASALKMAFGGWNKLGLAIAAQAYAIARAYGVDEALAAEGVDASRFVRAAPKAWRWAPEMANVADTCAELGLPEGLARGGEALFARWARHRDRPAGLEELLDDLRSVGEPRPAADPG
jgi:3-hydroxyisobutyrate dehydrogenase-like beta-hydroxyacid dehydrogenase